MITAVRIETFAEHLDASSRFSMRRIWRALRPRIGQSGLGGQRQTGHCGGLTRDDIRAFIGSP